jgi:hypothetical protein
LKLPSKLISTLLKENANVFLFQTGIRVKIRIFKFLILNRDTGADKHNNKSYNTAVQNGGQKLPVPAYLVPEKLKYYGNL